MEAKDPNLPSPAIECATEEEVAETEDDSYLIELPTELLIYILSFLSRNDIYSCRRLNKLFKGICDTNNGVWHLACKRLWGTLTDVEKWGSGKVLFRDLYTVFTGLQKLVGFWRGVKYSGDGPLVVFEWRNDCIVGSRVSAVKDDSYEVCKVPFVWLGVSKDGKIIAVLDRGNFDGSSGNQHSASGGHSNSVGGDFRAETSDSGSGSDGWLNSDAKFRWVLDSVLQGDCVLVAAQMSFVSDHHIVLEEFQEERCMTKVCEGSDISRSSSFRDFREERDVCNEIFLFGSAPNRFDSEMHRYFSNKVSHSGSARKQKKEQRRKERDRATSNWRRRSWEAEHFVKVVGCCPTPARPLQGLWKGLSNSMELYFILVTYDDLGRIICRKVGSSLQRLSLSGPVFWTADSKSFVEAPFSGHEEDIYNRRVHLRPTVCRHEDEEVAQVLSIYPKSLDSASSEGRLWRYSNGTFGFGFLNDNCISDFKLLDFSTGIRELQIRER